VVCASGRYWDTGHLISGRYFINHGTGTITSEQPLRLQDRGVLGWGWAARFPDAGCGGVWGQRGGGTVHPYPDGRVAVAAAAATKQPDGTLTAARIDFGRGDVLPWAPGP